MLTVLIQPFLITRRFFSSAMPLSMEVTFSETARWHHKKEDKNWFKIKDLHVYGLKWLLSFYDGNNLQVLIKLTADQE